MSHIRHMKIGDKSVKTTLIVKDSTLDGCLADLLSSITRNTSSSARAVVGLGIQKSFEASTGGNSEDKSTPKVSERVAVLMLCHGSICLIIQLQLMRSAPCSLSAFLQLPELSFAGVGIKHSLDALDRDYGIKCRNAVDLGELAAAVREAPLFRYLGLLDLAHKVCFLDDFKKMINSYNSAAFSNWAAVEFTVQQLEAATFSSFLCFTLANRLLGGF